MRRFVKTCKHCLVKLEVTGSSPVWSTICFIGPREGRRRVKPEMLVRVQRGTD